MGYAEFEGPDAGTQRMRFVCCPLCSWSHKLYKTDTFVTLKSQRVGEAKGWFKFDSGKKDLKTAPFIDVRDVSGGRGRSLRRIAEECLTLKEAMDKEEYRDVIKSLKTQISKIQKILESQK